MTERTQTERVMSYLQSRHERFLELMHPLYNLDSAPHPLKLRLNRMANEARLIKVKETNPIIELSPHIYGKNGYSRGSVSYMELATCHESGHYLRQVFLGHIHDGYESGEIVAELGALIFLSMTHRLNSVNLENETDALLSAIHTRFQTYRDIEEASKHLKELSGLQVGDQRENQEFRIITGLAKELKQKGFT